MKVKNIMFSGFAAAILMGVGAANAVVSDATYNLANTGYVDAKVDFVAGQKENAANKFTDATKDAWRSATNKDVQFPTINVAEQIALDSVAQISADVADLTDIRTKANKAAEDIAKLNGSAETPGSVANTIAAALSEKNYTTMQAVEEKGYLTAVPAEYVTSEELAAENYTTMQAVEDMGYVTAQGAKDAVATEGYLKSDALAPYAETADVEATYETKADASIQYATFETKTDATSKLAEAKKYTEDEIAELNVSQYAVAETVNNELAKKLDSTALTANGTYMVTKTDTGIEYTAVTVATAADAATE